MRFDGDGDDGLALFEARGAELRAQHPDAASSYAANLRPEDLAVLIYTSGTTGPPKGVMLTHDNLGFDAQVALDCGFEGLDAGVDVMSVLPYSHIYEHTLIYIYLLAKVRYYVCHDPADLLHDLRAVRPIGMTAVPRIFDRVLAGIKGQALGAGGLQARLVPWALAVGRRYMRARILEGRRARPWLAVQYAVSRALVLRKIRTRLGLRSRTLSHQRQCAAAHRYGDDVPGDGYSNHARVRPHGNIAGDFGEPPFGEPLRRGWPTDYRRGREDRTRR